MSVDLLQIDHVTVQIAAHTIVHEASLGVSKGEVVGIMGPNGCGKSTILRAVYRALKPHAGIIRLNGDDLQGLSHRASAQHVAALAQQSTSDIDFTVAETVAMGRIPHSNGGTLSAREQQLCDEAMASMGISHLRDRGMLSLSGGERQRALIARTLVQEPKLLVLDEPTNHLDAAHQVQLLRMLMALDLGVLVVLHDLNLAAAVCDRLHFVRDGRIVATGSPAELLDPDLVRSVFDVDVTVLPHPTTGTPQVLYNL